MTKMITLLGSTGSIGTQVLDVIRSFPERFRIEALAGGRNLSRLAEQVAAFTPRVVCIQNPEDVSAFRDLLKGKAPNFQGEILAGAEGLNVLAELPGADTVIVGLVGLIGLEPSLRALQAGKKLLTANKETFVTGGHLVQPYLGQIIPIDSEHVAIHQCLNNGLKTLQAGLKTIRTLYLTASGGPFLDFSSAQMAQVTIEQALKHPNWVMGRKITIDSATMMNKGLEVIEAHWLFGVPYEQIQVVVHPESVIHSGVEFVDGSVLVQMGAPDMHGPIQYAMTYPERLPHVEAAVKLDLFKLSRLNIQPPDLTRFPCIRLAYEAGRMGSSATAVLNGADEAVVQRFLDREIDFVEIPRILEAVLEAHQQDKPSLSPTLDEIFAYDAWAREAVARFLHPKAAVSA
jgi:1-deoxy-D-xylulose-5-phosphate reductoisomerase